MRIHRLEKVVDIYKNAGIRKLVQHIFGIFRKYVFRVIHSVMGGAFLRMRTPAGSITFCTDPSWGKWNRIASGQVYEPGLLLALHQSLDHSNVLYNVGARWGIISLFARRCGVPDSQIHNFEADADAVSILRQNVPHTVINHVFVGRGNSANELSLDGYAKEHSPPSVIKIDVEGAEAEVIKGASFILKNYSPELFIEIHPHYLTKQTEIIDLVQEYDYEIFVIDHRDRNAERTQLAKVTLPTDREWLLNAVSR